jgi:arylsulfatase A-like enzyme
MQLQILKRLVTVFALLALLPGCNNKRPQEKPKAQPKYNFLLITVDTLRADHLSCYGYKKKTSPNIDQLAREGVLFRLDIAQRGMTWPSLTSIQTSMYPHTHGVRDNGDKLDPTKITIAEILKRQGYTTGAVLRNMLNAPNRGFDTKRLIKGRTGEGAATQAAIRWLKANSKKPFYLWVHYMAPHRPYAPPPPFDTKFGSTDAIKADKKLDDITLNKLHVSEKELDDIRSLYDGEIAYDDSEIGSILATLNDLGLKEKTLVVFSADHGEELYDHNFYFYHGCSIYDSVLHVPLIMRLPDVIPERRKIPTMVQSIDIAPTVFDFLSLPRSPTFEGRSLKDLILSPKRNFDPAFAYSEIEDKIFSIRTNEYRYIYNPTLLHPIGDPYNTVGDERSKGYIIRKEELYDIVEDPLEQKDLMKEDPKDAAELQQQLLKWMQKAKTPYKHQQMDEKTMEELKSLGYIQ